MGNLLRKFMAWWRFFWHGEENQEFGFVYLPEQEEPNNWHYDSDYDGDGPGGWSS